MTLIVPLAAGSAGDILGRIICAELGSRFGQQFIVDNRVGAGGNIGMAATARAQPDGYTLGLGNSGPLSINAGLYATLPFDPVTDFAPIMPIVETFNGLIVPTSSPADSVQSLITYARSRPGALNYSSGGRGTTHHLSSALFAAREGLTVVHVPYKGAAEGVNAVMTNEVAFGFFNLPSVVSLTMDGKLRTLAVTSATRSPLLPSAPTMAEAGVKDFEISAWFGLFGPAGLPDPVADKLRDATAELMSRPAFKTRMQDIGFETMPVRTMSESLDYVRSELRKWVSIVKIAGATAQ